MLSVMNFTSRCIVMIFQSRGTSEKLKMSWEKGTKYYLFTHFLFDVLYNGNQVIEIHAFSDPNHAVDVTEDIDIDVEFTYSVNWKATSTQFQNRMDKYSKASLMPVRQKIHWFSFIIIIIVLLMGLLALLIVRRLKNEMKKFSNSDEEEDKEVGWKYIHGDVFRYPPNMSLFCAVLGVGTQLLAMLFILFLLAFFGVLYLNLGKSSLCLEGTSDCSVVARKIVICDWY